MMWWEQAKCGLADAEAMTDDGRLNIAEINRRQETCQGCPVVPECAKYALAQPKWSPMGVYAGEYLPATSGPQRQHAFRRLRRKAGMV